jgi:hypothetical protein
MNGHFLRGYGLSGFPRWAAEGIAAVLGPLVARYVEAQRDRLSLTATPLSQLSKLRLRQHFSDADLERVRVALADPLPIPDPPFYPLFRRLRLDIPEPSLVDAITFDHVIAARESMGLPLLFHEMVHVVQYRLLSVKVFARLYVKGFFATGGYHGIPIERCALEMEERFINAPEPFDVEREIANWIERSGCDPS